MLRLKTLKFSGIGRFIDEQSINFDGLGNLNQIEGQNNNTGGSSGAGKSTIFQALSWLLGFSDQSTNVLQSRLTKDTISVSGEFDWDGKQVLIHRSKKLSVTVDGIETVGSSKLAEEKLDEILGLSRNLFKVLVHRSQGQSGFFLEFTPAKMNEFLTDCLGLSTISSKIDSVESKVKELTGNRLCYEMDLKAAQAALKATQDAYQSLGEEPVSNITQDHIELANAALNTATDKLELLKIQHVKEIDTLNQKKPDITVIPFDKTTLNALETNIKEAESCVNKRIELERNRVTEINKKIATVKSENNEKLSALKLQNSKQTSSLKAEIVELTQIIKTGENAKKSALEITKQLKVLRSGICHTCQQDWQTNEAKIEENKLLSEFSNHKVTVEASIKASQEIETLKEKLSLLTEDFNKETLTLEKELNEVLSNLNAQTKPQNGETLSLYSSKLIELNENKLKEQEKEKTYNAFQNSTNKRLMDSFLCEQKLLADSHREQISRVNKELQESKSAYDNFVSTLKSYEEAVKKHRILADSLKNKEKEMVSKVVDMNQKAVGSTEMLEIAEETKRCLKSYLSCSFDDALDSISETATKILRSVPTMANATIRLEGTKETGEGIVKNQINACIDNDGEIGVPIKSLSGGERSAVDLAVDLAVTVLIEERTNIGCDILCLDEVFGGFDSVGIENALEMLKTLDKKILLIEHNPIAKEFVQNKITVIRDGEFSFLQK